MSDHLLYDARLAPISHIVHETMRASKPLASSTRYAILCLSWSTVYFPSKVSFRTWQINYIVLGTYNVLSIFDFLSCCPRILRKFPIPASEKKSSYAIRSPVSFPFFAAFDTCFHVACTTTTSCHSYNWLNHHSEVIGTDS